MTVPYVFAPAQMNRQRASCVAALGMKALNEGYTGVKYSRQTNLPDYLRKSQAERRRDENSPDGQAGKLRELLITVHGSAFSESSPQNQVQSLKRTYKDWEKNKCV